jgi:hypothetical protein
MLQKVLTFRQSTGESYKIIYRFINNSAKFLDFFLAKPFFPFRKNFPQTYHLKNYYITYLYFEEE